MYELVPSLAKDGKINSQFIVVIRGKVSKLVYVHILYDATGFSLIFTNIVVMLPYLSLPSLLTVITQIYSACRKDFNSSQMFRFRVITHNIPTRIIVKILTRTLPRSMQDPVMGQDLSQIYVWSMKDLHMVEPWYAEDPDMIKLWCTQDPYKDQYARFFHG